jgi:hypothetical protein
MFHVSIQTKVSDSSWSAVPNNTLLQRLSHRDSMRWIATFKVAGEEHRIALGSPDGSQGALSLALPEWFLESTGLMPDEEVIVHFQPCEGMTSARNLRFKTLEALPDWLDVRDVLEEPLSQLGVIKQGQMLPVPVLDSVVLILESAEPADDFLFLDGEGIEIDVIMDESVSASASASANAEQEQEHKQEQEQEQDPGDFSFLPTLPPQRTGFVPFSGKGRTLGTGHVVYNSHTE